MFVFLVYLERYTFETMNQMRKSEVLCDVVLMTEKGNTNFMRTGVFWRRVVCSEASALARQRSSIAKEIW